MKPQLSKSPEHWAMNVLGDMMTRGKIDIVKKLWYLFVKIQASVALVFFRFRTGTKFISSATLFCGYLMMTFCWMAEQTYRLDWTLTTGEAPAEASSMGLFILTIIAFGIIGMFHLFESRRNLRRTDGKGQSRYDNDSGLSLLWVPFKRLTEPIGWIAPAGEPPRWWQWSEFKFQKFFEPLLIILIGVLFRQLDYLTFGSYIILCGFCAFMLMVHREDEFYEQKQESWNAEVLSSVILHRDQPVDRQRGAIVQQAIIRSDKGFEQWKASFANRPAFAKSHPYDHATTS